MNSGIYCYENIINGKRYIGQSYSIKERIAKHESNFKRNSCKWESPLLWRAVRKYGRCNFSLSIVEYAPKSKLDELEIYYIDKLDTYYLRHGYNLTLGGSDGGGVGYKKSGSTSEYFGVFLRKRKRYSHWICCITLDGIQKELGYFQDEKFSALYYDNFVIQNNLQELYPLNFSEKERVELGIEYASSVYKPKGKKSTASSSFYGVRRKIVANRYIYYFSFIGKTHIGCFKKEIDAALSYNQYIIENNLSYPLNEIKE